MKRIVLCCDGTWNHAVNARVTNVEKLQRCVVQGLVPGDDDVVQVVGYVGGVGARGYKVDQLLGGAFGYGLTRNVVDGYRFLATTWAPGDEIYVVGYSRGAFTARSVVGMIAQVGLLTPDAVDAGRLDDALATYRSSLDEPGARRAKDDFATRYSYDPRPRVKFLGVYDTVGALGVPGLTRGRSRFHDVVLSGIVDVARQGLAIDERRMTFTPCLWQVPEGSAPGRVQQVWFPGGHGDVGGGSTRCGLSDVTLRWMAGELVKAGLVLDQERLEHQLSHDPLVIDTGPNALYQALNLGRRIVSRSGKVDGREVFRDGLRVLALPAAGAAPGSAPDSAAGTVAGSEAAPATRWSDAVVLASTAARYAVRDEYARRARNLGWWASDAGGIDHVPTVDVGTTDDGRLVTR